MKDEEKFEDSWRGAFEGAEVKPSDSVWSEIDLDLANAEGTSMKKRLVFYQRLAAASVLFALTIGAFSLYQWNDQPSIAKSGEKEKSNAVQENQTTANAANADSKSNTSAQLKPERNASRSLDNKIENQTSVNSESQKHPAVADKNNIDHNVASKKNETDPNNATVRHEKNIPLAANETALVADNNSVNAQKKGYHEGRMAAIASPGLFPFEGVQGEPEYVEIFRKLPAIPAAFMAERKKDNTTHEKLWASVTAASGNYTNPSNNYSNMNYVSGQLTSGSNSTAVGSAYSFGMLAGMRVSPRFVIQSGVQYSNQSINSYSNINSTGSLAAVALYANHPTSPVNSVTMPYTIVSANEFLSVPVQAGYLFLDKKVGLQLNSGVSTDFFVRNTLTDPSGARQSYSVGAGQDSPYRSVNFSGLLSSEVSYKLGSRYRVSLVPGFRYSFSPLLKSSTSSVNPMVWDLGFRFRYIFK